MALWHFPFSMVKPRGKNCWCIKWFVSPVPWWADFCPYCFLVSTSYLLCAPYEETALLCSTVSRRHVLICLQSIMHERIGVSTTHEMKYSVIVPLVICCVFLGCRLPYLVHAHVRMQRRHVCKRLVLRGKEGSGPLSALKCPQKNNILILFHLRIPDSYHAKTLKNHTPLERYALHHNYQVSLRWFYTISSIEMLVWTNILADLYIALFPLYPIAGNPVMGRY